MFTIEVPSMEETDQVLETRRLPWQSCLHEKKKDSGAAHSDDNKAMLMNHVVVAAAAAWKEWDVDRHREALHRAWARRNLTVSFVCDELKNQVYHDCLLLLPNH